MASAPSSKEWKEFLLSPKVLVPVAATVGVVATAGCIYYCWPKEKGKTAKSKIPKKAPSANAVPADPKPSTKPLTKPSTKPSETNAKAEDKGGSAVVVEEKKEPAAPTLPNTETANKKEVKATAEEEKTPLEQANNWRLRGNKWFKAERYDKALQYYKEALKVCPADKPKERAVFHQNIAAAYERIAQAEKDKDKRLEYIQYVVDNTCEALSLDPQYAKPYARRARAYTMLGRDLDALFDYMAVTLIDEDIGRLVTEDFEKMMQKVVKERVQRRCEARTWPPSPESSLPDSISHSSVLNLLNVFCQQRYLSSKGLSEIWSELDTAEMVDEVGEEQDEVVKETEDEVVMKTEGETVKETEGEVVKETEGEVVKETEGEVVKETEGEVVEETEGEVVKETEGEVAKETEGEVVKETEGEVVKETIADVVVVETGGDLSDQPLARAVEAFERRNYRVAVTLCEEALEKGAECLKPFAALLKGTLFQLWHLTDLALSELDTVLSMPQATTEAKVYAHIMRAEVFTEESNETAALVEYEKALLEDKDNADIFLFRAKLFLVDGEAANPGRGLEDMNSAQRLRKKDPKVASSLAYATFKVGVLTNSMQMIEESIVMIKSLANRHPSCAVVFATYGHMLQESLQVEMAREQFSRAVELEPGNALHHISLCFSVLFSGANPQEAEQHAEKAIEVDPYCGLGYQAKAAMELQKSNIDEGMRLYKRSVELTLSKTEMAQCVTAHLMSEMQIRVCNELGLDMHEVMQKAENSMRRNLGMFP